MAIPESTLKLFQSLDLETFTLPDGTKAWHIDRHLAKLLQAKMGKEPEVKKILPLGGKMYYWGSQDPVMILTPNDSGIVFVSLEKAKDIIPKLRQHGLFKEELFWYVVIEREELEQLIADPENLADVPSLGEGFISLSATQSVLKQIGGGIGMWFKDERDARSYQESIWELERLI